MNASRGKPWLILGGLLSVIAALMHFAIILGGPSWYRFFGAGEQMAQMAQDGMLYPTIVTSVIGVILGFWGLYAFSAAGLLPRLPLLRTGVVCISLVYLARGAGGLTLSFFEGHPLVLAEGTSFWLWSSLICLFFGLVYSYGMYLRWPMLSVRQ